MFFWASIFKRSAAFYEQITFRDFQAISYCLKKENLDYLNV